MTLEDVTDKQLRRLVGRYPNSPVAVYARMVIASRHDRGVALDYGDVRNVLRGDDAVVRAVLTAIEDEQDLRDQLDDSTDEVP